MQAKNPFAGIAVSFQQIILFFFPITSGFLCAFYLFILFHLMTTTCYCALSDETHCNSAFKFQTSVLEA